MIAKLFLLLFVIFQCNARIEAATVAVKGEKGTWVLQVDNKPFYIKGAGCGLATGKNGEDYLRLAKELGANALRTWGTDQGTKEYLDRAAKYGLMVDAGIWINYADPAAGFSYIGDTEYKKNKRQEVLEYIKQFKNHPAILMWNLGNEAIFFTSSAEEKVALCQFLEGLIQEIHLLDPTHPVIYTSAGYVDLPYLKKYVPRLDLIGMNVYGSIRTSHGTWDYFNINKPYIITEYGPYLSQDSQRDVNGKAIELSDEQKASIYKKFYSDIKEFMGFGLGGFIFHLGETTQESMTWWNINQGNLKRKSFWAIYEAYTGKKTPYILPKIKNFSLSKQKELKPGEVIGVEVQVEYPKPGELNYSYALSTTQENILEYYVNKYVDCEVIGEGNKVNIKLPEKEGAYRLYVFIKDRYGNTTSQNKTVSVK